MSSPVPVITSSPFTKTVVGAMKKLYPEALADKSFDNTGLLLEAPYRPNNTALAKSALLTIDLTKAVAEEAIKGKYSIVIAYHPIIFRALKAITLSNTQQNTLLRLASEGISVYSPHTAVDAAPGGLNDWLADVITGLDAKTKTGEIISHTRKIINPVPGLDNLAADFSSSGYGQIVTFTIPQTLGGLVQRVIKGTYTESIESNLTGNSVSVAVPQTCVQGQRSGIEIRTVGICAGSGGSILNGLDVDLLLTGELSHHEALAAIEAGRCVITTCHSNSERAYLEERMKPALKRKIKEELNSDDLFSVDVSKYDRDPYSAIVPTNLDW
ncbi:related to Ngg1p-interacting factor 3 [Rhynchosporium agropyri]|uniref:Related to Ngg1p-interacting factor 3 n=1 Tax=Rhynchosporium agropyri TaxID=914238 RepID=A0A1E1KK31_9HELO|nr:related to Ngg1p-interacting factor 3 [Rhynchosporium agropyri]